MVMMQSPNLDTPKSASPLKSTPCSPPNQTKTKHVIDTQTIKFEPIVLERPQPTKYGGTLLGNQHEKYDFDIKSLPLTYPKDVSDIDANTKFSLERLKQLSNRSLYNRHSLSDDSNESLRYPVGAKINESSPKTKGSENDIVPSVNSSHNRKIGGCPFPTIFTNNPSDMDIGRLKLARNKTNGKEFTDFRFRIQLGEIHSDYAHSDTSEELVVDERSESLPTGDSTTVCCIMFERKLNKSLITCVWSLKCENNVYRNSRYFHTENFFLCTFYCSVNGILISNYL